MAETIGSVMQSGARGGEKGRGSSVIDSATRELEMLCQELGGQINLEGGDILAACREIRAACSQGGGWGIRSRQVGEAISRAEETVVRVDEALQKTQEKAALGWGGGVGSAQGAEVGRLRKRVEELEACAKLQPTWPLPPILGMGGLQGGGGSGGGEKGREDEVYVDENGEVCLR
jgi:hypothetical protein